MNLKQHLIATGAASAALLPFGDTTGILLFACGSILIDVDHQIFYYYKTGKCDVSGMFRTRTFTRYPISESASSIRLNSFCSSLCSPTIFRPLSTSLPGLFSTSCWIFTILYASRCLTYGH